MLIRVKRPASRTVTIGSSATGRASDRRRWTSDIGLTATVPLSRYCDINASGARMVSECARDGSPRYWAARGCHRKMWNAAGDILWIVVGGPSGERCFERSAHATEDWSCESMPETTAGKILRSLPTILARPHSARSETRIIPATRGIPAFAAATRHADR